MRKFCILIVLMTLMFSCSMENYTRNEVALWHNVPVNRVISSDDICLARDSGNYYEHYYVIHAAGNWEIEVKSDSDVPFAISMSETAPAILYPPTTEDNAYIYKSFKTTHRSYNPFYIMLSFPEELVTIGSGYVQGYGEWEPTSYTITARLK